MSEPVADDDFPGLLARARRRDPAGLEALMEQAAAFSWRMLRRFHTLSEAAREDLAHDVVLRLLERGLAQFSGSTAPEWRAYLKRMTINHAISVLRRDDIPPLWRFEEPEIDPSREMEQVDAYRHLAECVGELALIDQQIFWMRTRELPYGEMVEMLGIPQGTIASKYNRAQQKVTHCLEEVGLR